MPLAAVAVNAVGAVGGVVSEATALLPVVRKAATMAPQLFETLNVALAATGPAAACCWSSTVSLVFGATGTRSSIAYPLPATTVAGSADEVSPMTRSPFAVVVAFPLFADVPLPCAAAAASSEFAPAMPAYSSKAKRSVPPEIESATVTVFAPPTMFSA